ncbi:unnamed protein product [Gadus morhua 'NCC']
MTGIPSSGVRTGNDDIVRQAVECCHAACVTIQSDGSQSRQRTARSLLRLFQSACPDSHPGLWAVAAASWSPALPPEHPSQRSSELSPRGPIRAVEALRWVVVCLCHLGLPVYY